MLRAFYATGPCSRGQRLSRHLRKANNIVPFCLSPVRVIDPFSQMKREYNTILDDADSANRNTFVPSQSFAWCSSGNFSQGDQIYNVSVKSKLQHPPPPHPGTPRAFDTFVVSGRREFDYQSLPGCGEFEPHARGWGIWTVVSISCEISGRFARDELSWQGHGVRQT